MFWVLRKEEQKLEGLPKQATMLLPIPAGKAEAEQSKPRDRRASRWSLCCGQRQQDVPQWDMMMKDSKPKGDGGGGWTSKVSACPSP